MPKEDMLRIERVPGLLYIAYVIWLDDKGDTIRKEQYHQDDLEPVPMHSDQQFEALLKAFSELKEEHNRLLEEHHDWLMEGREMSG